MIAFIVGVTFLILLSAIQWFVGYINGARQMPLVPMSFINMNHTPTFELLSIYQMYCGYSYGIIVAAMDTLTSSVSVHIYIQLCILKESIIRMRSRIVLRTQEHQVCNRKSIKQLINIKTNNTDFK